MLYYINISINDISIIEKTKKKKYLRISCDRYARRYTRPLKRQIAYRDYTCVGGLRAYVHIDVSLIFPTVQSISESIFRPLDNERRHRRPGYEILDKHSSWPRPTFQRVECGSALREFQKWFSNID